MTLIKNEGLNQYIFLLSVGDYMVTDHHIVLSANICESVCVCLIDNENQIGGMNNLLIPNYTFNPDKIYTKDTRIGVHLMDMLINEMIKIGSKRRNIKAKIFGGSFDGINNIYFVKKYLEIEEIPIISSDIDNSIGRKIFFHTVGGKVLLKKINDQNKINEIRINEAKELINFKQIFNSKKIFINFEDF